LQNQKVVKVNWQHSMLYILAHGIFGRKVSFHWSWISSSVA